MRGKTSSPNIVNLSITASDRASAVWKNRSSTPTASAEKLLPAAISSSLLIEFIGQGTLPCGIGLVQHLVVDLVRLRILVIAVILAADRVRQPSLDIDHRVDDAVAIAAGRDVEIAAAQRSKPRTAGNDF